MKLISLYSCFTILSFLFTACGETVLVLETETIVLTNADEIVPLEDSLVRPVLYQNIPNFGNLPVKESKRKFIATVLPAVLIAKHHLSVDQDNIQLLSTKKKWITEDSSFYENQSQRFGANNIQDLLDRMNTHPNSIVLAQAAVESGWGSSRFFREANNLFGIWSYKSEEPRIPAGQNDVYLRKYKDVSQSIEDYFVTLGRARPYRAFRDAKVKSEDIDELLPHLKPYSQRGWAYIAQLKTVIRQNNLTQYDSYKLDPRFFVEK